MTDGVLTLIALGLCAEVLLIVTWLVERAMRPAVPTGPDRSRGLRDE